MAHEIHLKNSKYRQWVKAGLGLGYLKEGLAPFCDDIGKQQHKDIINQIQGTKTPKPIVPCGVCQITTLQPDHVRVSKVICPLKQDKCNCCFPNNKKPCPNNICGAIYDSIIQNHASIPPAPFWRNSDAHDWSIDPWSICKCFINAPGYKDKTSAADVDCSALLHVIINNKYFHNHIGCNVTGPNNLFAKVRQYRNAIFHSSCMELDETEANSYIDDMISILQDGKDLVHHLAAQRAVRKLQDLKKKDFIITTDGFEEVLGQIKEEMTKVSKSIENAATKEEYNELKNNLSDLETKMTREKEEKQRLNDEDSSKQRELECEKASSELQGDLIKFYRKRCSSIPLSPLLEEIETPLAGFYVMPDIVAVKQKSLTCHEEERTPMKSLKDLFSTGSADQQEIYLSADAGFGKTAFSKYLAITWCQAHCHDKNYACFKDDELKTLFDFKFLFLVLLRDCTSVCNIDDMIEQQITKKLPSSATINEVLRGEKCLIILDGLDEWAHPNNSCSEVTEQIPHRYVRDNCVILTTTRPWKLGVSNLKTCQINKKVELVQLSADSTRQLEENAIRKMTGVHNDRVLKSKTQDFNKVISDRRLEHMQVIPLLLLYIVCLWCNNISIGNSKHEMYSNIIEFLLSRTSKKHPEVQLSRETSASEISDYFKSHEFCKKFYSLIISLAELAYQTLFSENRENTLVFDRTVAEKYLRADDMKLSLLSGILSESRSKTLIKEIIKLSFSHKTVQEFFAAIFISSQSDAQKTVLEKCINVQDILDMSKICEFTSGMNADRMCAISSDLMSVINKDEKTRDYRTRTGREDMYNINALYNIQKMFTSCLQEMPQSENIQLCLQDFFINEDTVHSKQLQRLLKQNKTNIKSLYIYIRFTSSSLREIIDFFSLTDLSYIQKLYYYGDEKKEAEINRLLFPSLKYVSLWSGKWTNEEEDLSENMARCQNLQYLYIGDFTLSHKILETFFNFISGQKSMKELTLDELDYKQNSGHDCKRWNLDLSQLSILSNLDLRGLSGRLQLNISTPSLVNVRLSGINLDESLLLLARDMLNIERVVMEYIEMTARSLQNFISVLENLPQSVTVKMLAVKPETEYIRVRENMRRSQTFHVIRDDGGWWGTFEFKTIKPSKQ
ncbi:uncharacterized protein LOC132742740 [Ruditapes philippinarum]|uniref:uncharacterized protein LOC132742740 n=1 Tax=Ruditapes philippinarum TaxID=129788 RepID=UPI00295BEAA3|nr:uncharacterized protein LOC132742740 [Ruditapes philippinarum]